MKIEIMLPEKIVPSSVIGSFDEFENILKHP
jgi:hypothetical protein